MKKLFIILLFVSVVNAHVSDKDIDPSEDGVRSLGDADHRWLANILKISNLTTNGFVVTTGSDGALSIQLLDTTGLSKNDTLLYDGTTWKTVPEGTSFTFDITDFDDNLGTTILCGDGEWLADSAADFDATYDEYSPLPTTNADVQMSINDAAYAKVGEMTSGSDYEEGTNSEGAINYPSRGQYHRFRLYGNDGTDTEYYYESYIYFQNYIYWGDSDVGSGFDEAEVEAIDDETGSRAISSDYTISKSITVGAGEYAAMACPASYTDMDTGSDYEDDGNRGTGFRFGGITCAMGAKEIVSVGNDAGNPLTENYDVYASSSTNLGAGTFYSSTDNTAMNYLYYGVSDQADPNTEAVIEALSESEISGDNTQIWNELTAGVGEYLVFAFPKRLGEPDFKDNATGLPLDLYASSPQEASVTNANGWSEDYYVWRSQYANLGTITIYTE